MESDKEGLNRIVSERADKIQVEAQEEIKHIQERTETELGRIVPDLVKQIEDFPTFKLLDVLNVLRDGGTVKTCDHEIQYDNAPWRLELGGSDPFYGDRRPNTLGKGRYRVTLIMEKLAEEEEA